MLNSEQPFKKNELFFLFSIFLAGILIIFGPYPHFYTSGDTFVIVESIKIINDCINNQQFNFCNNVSHFPLSQQLYGVILSRLGLSYDKLLGAFTIINVISWIAGLLLPLIYWNKKKYYTQYLVYIAIYFTSPLWWYAANTFNEMHAASMIVLLFLSMMYGRYLSLLTSLMVILTKEIAFIYVIFLASVIGYQRYKKRDPNYRKMLFGATIGCLIGLSIQFIFNLWRFKSVANTTLLSPLFQTPTLELKINFFLAQWISPNAGIAFFWPGFFLLLVVFYRFYLKDLKNKLDVSFLFVTIYILTITFGFASWFAPFGWVAYGHRLFVPWIPGLAIYIVAEFFENFKLQLKKITQKKWKVFMWMQILLTIPSVAILFSNRSIGLFFTPDETCPHTAILQNDSNYYFYCITHGAWSAKWIYYTILSNINDLRGYIAIFIIVYVLVFIFKRIEKSIYEN